MPEAHANFHSANGMRRVLIVEDEAISREMLQVMIQDDYEVLLAEDGEEAMRLVWQHRETLSLVLLDLIMPVISGQEVLQRIKESPGLRHIPVIVTSADQSQEINCLDMGATDFIQKPYPEAAVIKARMRRTIELSEGRQLIQSTERDPKTGLYNPEYFYNYAEQYDQYHHDVPTDAIVVDINHFSMINERLGRAYADAVLARIASTIRELIHGSGGIVTRIGADVFLVYCPHREDYKSMMDKITACAVDERSANRPIRLRMGVYANTDKRLAMDRRFDRAQKAADTVRDSYKRNIGVYDDGLLKSELFSQRLVDDFSHALERGEFVVFFQPKYDIQGDVPRLGGAEALVRWRHPELGMVSPGVFVPLFENNGLIQQLDHYVWDVVARQVRDWRQQLGWYVPVSVNVSRADLYDSAIVDELQRILDKNGLGPDALRLEVAESAYVEDSKQIIEVVGRLRALGIRIELDDFGIGCMSLNMLATLPIDVLKLDMRFVRTAFSGEGDNDVHMLGTVVDIARHLGVPLIAEGVETREQLEVLQTIGCDAVQGYYFSEPVPAEQVEPLLVVAKEQADKDARVAQRDRGKAARLPMEDEPPMSWWERLPAVSVGRAEVVAVCLSVLMAVALVVAMSVVSHGRQNVEQANARYILAQRAAADLEMGSDYLTENVRSFVMTGDLRYLNNYFEELDVTKRRDHAVRNMEELLVGSDNDKEALRSLSLALQNSNELVVFEDQAMKLRLLADGVSLVDMPLRIRDVRLRANQEGLSNEQRQSMAEELVFGSNYATYKQTIKTYVDESVSLLLQSADELRAQASADMSVMLVAQYVCAAVLFLIVLVNALFTMCWVRMPLGRMVQNMRRRELVLPAGAKELRFVAETYNSIFEDNRKRFERLNYRSMHDALTGLFNRKAYDIMSRELDLTSVALLLVDVDRFKGINDTYGHDVGDMVLVRVAEVLGYSFRSTDLVFRLGGDEFVVIMTNVDSSSSEQVRRKIEQANLMLQQPTDDLPPTSLSVGAAFADRKNPKGDIFKDADTALYRMKQSGRCGCVIY